MTIQVLALSIAIVLFVIAMIYAGVMDLLTMTIDNRIILFLFLLCSVSAPLSGIGMVEFGFNVLAALVVFFVSTAFFALGWIGGGDCKLATATALWMGSDHTFQYISSAAIFGGVLTILLLLFRTVDLPVGWQTRCWVASLHSPNTGVPYGVALALSGLYTIKDTAWIGNIV